MAAKSRKRLTIKEIKAKHYSPAYEKRLIRAARKGKTRQAARGHKPKEHIERKEREILARGITRDQERTIRNFYAKKLDPETHPFKWVSNGDVSAAIKEAPSVSEILEFAIVEGYGAFKNYQNVWYAANRTYKREQADGSYQSRGFGYLLTLNGMAKAPDQLWLYYH